MSERAALLFILDAGSRVGMGHLTRESILVGKFRSRGYRCAVWVRKGSIRECRRFFPAGTIWCTRPAEAKKFAASARLGAVILDVMGTPSRKTIGWVKPGEAKIILIGHYPRIPSWADLCIDPHAGGRDKKIISGLSHVVLSDGFERYRRKNPELGRPLGAKNIFVLPGGGNTKGMVFKILRALDPLPEDYRVDLAVGHYFTRKKELSKAVSGFGRRLRVISACSPERIRRLMCAADLGILSYGRSVDEARCVGMPSLLLSSSPLNAHGSRSAARQGGTVYLGDFRRLSAASIRRPVLSLMRNARKRRALAEKGARLIDGKGAARVVRLIERVVRDEK